MQRSPDPGSRPSPPSKSAASGADAASSGETVEVFHFLEIQPVTGHWRIAPFKATRSLIESELMGRVIEGTREMVPMDELDAQGRFVRVAIGWGVRANGRSRGSQCGCE